MLGKMKKLVEEILRETDGKIISVVLEASDGRILNVVGVNNYSQKAPTIKGLDNVSYPLNNGFAIREFC